MPFVDYYKLLGVQPTSSEQEIKEAYRKLSKKFHPDLNDGDDFFAERFKDIQAAYETLINTNKRAIYQQSYNAFYHKSENPGSQFKNSNPEDNTNQTTRKENFKSKEKINKTGNVIYIIIPILIAIAFGIFKGLLKKEIREKSYNDMQSKYNSSQTTTSTMPYNGSSNGQLSTQPPNTITPNNINTETISAENYPIGYYIVQATSSNRVYAYATPNPDALLDLYYSTRMEVYIQKVLNGYGYIDEGNGPKDKYWLDMRNLVLVSKDEMTFNSVTENEDYILSKLREYTVEETEYFNISNSRGASLKVNFNYKIQNKKLVVSFTDFYTNFDINIKDTLNCVESLPLTDFQFPISKCCGHNKIMINSLNENVEQLRGANKDYYSFISLPFRAEAETDLLKNLSLSLLKLRNAYRTYNK